MCRMREGVRRGSRENGKEEGVGIEGERGVYTE